MGKVKNLEKKTKSVTEFDKKKPENRVKSLNADKNKAKSNLEKKNRNAGKKKKDQKKKKLKILQQLKKEVVEQPTEKVAEPKELPEKLVKREITKKAIIAVKDGIKKEMEKIDSKNLFDDELRIGLQIIFTKIPDCPPHVKKIMLSHSLFEEKPDICFIIRDQVPKKADQDENIRNFQEKLKMANIDCVKTIIPLSKIKQDYNTHNLRLKLCNTYDIFLVESEIAEHAYTLLGKVFIVKRKRPLQINTKKEQMKISIENAMKKVSFKINSKSVMSSFEIGTMKMDNVKIADNIMSAIDQLKEKWPGGWLNILRIYLKPMKPSKISIPLYYSNINPNDVSRPVIKGSKLNRLDKLAEKLKNQAQKLKLDIKTKKVLKKSNEKKPPKTTKSKSDEKKIVTIQNKGNEKVKDKKRKREETEIEKIQPDTVKEENENNEIVKEPIKKKKKKDQKDIPISDDFIKIKGELDEILDNNEESFSKKKKKKDRKNSETINESVQAPEPELKKSKNKNKSKTKSPMTDAINVHDEKIEIVETSEKEQISKKKKKKVKKNKA